MASKPSRHGHDRQPWACRTQRQVPDQVCRHPLCTQLSASAASSTYYTADSLPPPPSCLRCTRRHLQRMREHDGKAMQDVKIVCVQCSSYISGSFDHLNQPAHPCPHHTTHLTTPIPPALLTTQPDGTVYVHPALSFRMTAAAQQDGPGQALCNPKPTRSC